MRGALISLDNVTLGQLVATVAVYAVIGATWAPVAWWRRRRNR